MTIIKPLRPEPLRDIIYQDEMEPRCMPRKDEGSIWWNIAPEIPLPSKETIDRAFVGKPQGAKEAFETMIAKANRASRIVRIGIYKELLNVTRKPVFKGYKMFVIAGNKRLPVKFVGEMYPDITRAINDDEMENSVIQGFAHRKFKQAPDQEVNKWLLASYKLEMLGYIYLKPSPVHVIDTERKFTHLDKHRYAALMSWYESETDLKPAFPVHDKFKEKIYEYIEVGHIYSNDFDIVGNEMECKVFEYDVTVFEKVHETMSKIAEYLLRI